MLFVLGKAADKVTGWTGMQSDQEGGSMPGLSATFTRLPFTLCVIIFPFLWRCCYTLCSASTLLSLRFRIDTLRVRFFGYFFYLFLDTGIRLSGFG